MTRFIAYDGIDGRWEVSVLFTAPYFSTVHVSYVEPDAWALDDADIEKPTLKDAMDAAMVRVRFEARAIHGGGAL